MLEQVAARVEAIAEQGQRRNLAACIEVLAGLRFDENLINQLFTEEMMQESVIYQRILRKGVEQGVAQGVKQEALALILRQLARRFGAVDPQLQERLQGLSTPQLEDLSEALLDFQQAGDVAVWLDALAQ